MRVVSILAIGVFLVLADIAGAQTSNTKSQDITISIPEVALLDLESSTTSSAIRLNAVAPNEAGNSLDFSSASSNDIWLNYSSIVGSSQPSRKVCAFIEGSVPDGVIVSVTASSYSGNGKGRNGAPIGNVILSNNMQDIITNIGSCYTGNGPNNGHKLTYSLELDRSNDSYGKLKFDQSANISVTYILSDNN
jgi:hypothetical protein